MKILLINMLVAVASLMAWGCSSRPASASMPRPEAYPRIDALVPDYRTIDSLSKHIVLTVNAGAEIAGSTDGNETWIDVAYPTYYGSVLRLTLIELSGSKLDEALAARMERMRINVVINTLTSTELTNAAGIETMIVRSDGAVATPLQVLASDYSTFLLYGVLDIPGANPAEAAKYLPITEAVVADVEAMAQNMQRR